MKVQHIMLKAPHITVKVQRIMMKAQHVKNIDHIRQSWLSIVMRNHLLVLGPDHGCHQLWLYLVLYMLCFFLYMLFFYLEFQYLVPMPSQTKQLKVVVNPKFSKTLFRLYFLKYLTNHIETWHKASVNHVTYIKLVRNTAWAVVAMTTANKPK